MGLYGGFRITGKGKIKPYAGYSTGGCGCCLLPFVVIILIVVGVLCLIF